MHHHFVDIAYGACQWMYTGSVHSHHRQGVVHSAFGGTLTIILVIATIWA